MSISLFRVGQVSWLKIKSENPDDWTDQEHIVKISSIVGFRLAKALANTRVESGIEVTVQGERSYTTNRYWMRYLSFEKAQEDFDEIFNLLQET